MTSKKEKLISGFPNRLSSEKDGDQAEKIAASHTVQYFRARAGRAGPQAFLAVLDRIKQAAGPLVAGDEL